MKRTAFFASLLFSGISGFSQKDTVELVPVEVRSVRAGKLAPFAKTNINKTQIEKQNLGQDLPFLLNQTPSVVVNSDAGNGIGYTGIRIRGTDATRINVTLNGVPFNDAESGGTYFVDLPDFLSSTNSIQIQRGVGTSSNGAGAFGASINLSTNEVSGKAYLELNNSYGSFNTWKNTLKFGSGLLGNHFTLDARLSNITSDGFIDRAKTDLKSSYLSLAYLNSKTTLRFNTFSGQEKTYQAWNGVSEADLATNRTTNSAGTEKPGEPYDNETDNYKQTHYQLFLTQKLSSNWVFNTGLFYVKGKGYYEQYKADQKYSKYGLPNQINGSQVITKSDIIRQLWLDNDFYGDIFSFQKNHDGTEFTFGGAATNYIGKHFGEVVWAKAGLSGNTRYYDHDADKSDFNLYGKWQQRIGAGFQFYTDLQYRTASHHIDGFKENPALLISKSYGFLNPKIGLSYQKSEWSGFASYSIAHKEPNRDDFEAGASELPKPEQLQDFEANIAYGGKRFNWSATFYYMNYRDQLVLTGKINDVGAYTRTNISKSYRAGIELEGGVQIVSWAKAAVNVTFSQNRIRHFNEFIDDYDNGGQKTAVYDKTDIAFSPAVTGAATITLTPVKALEIDLQSKYVSKQYLDNTSNEFRKLNAYYTQDAKAIYSFSKKWLKNVSLIGQVNNIFNKKYEPNGYTFSYYYNNSLATENYYFPMAGTNWMIGLNIKL
ncbi:MAG: TonB-dependent receptor [Flaviaesturariibacter sp.]|nr:TonB-dependent receptor [Flaviaesturariibacter sp.]